MEYVRFLLYTWNGTFLRALEKVNIVRKYKWIYGSFGVFWVQIQSEIDFPWNIFVKLKIAWKSMMCVFSFMTLTVYVSVVCFEGNFSSKNFQINFIEPKREWHWMNGMYTSINFIKLNMNIHYVCVLCMVSLSLWHNDWNSILTMEYLFECVYWHNNNAYLPEPKSDNYKIANVINKRERSCWWQRTKAIWYALMGIHNKAIVWPNINRCWCSWCKSVESSHSFENGN